MQPSLAVLARSDARSGAAWREAGPSDPSPGADFAAALARAGRSTFGAGDTGIADARAGDPPGPRPSERPEPSDAPAVSAPEGDPARPPDSAAWPPVAAEGRGATASDAWSGQEAAPAPVPQAGASADTWPAAAPSGVDGRGRAVEPADARARLAPAPPPASQAGPEGAGIAAAAALAGIGDRARPSDEGGGDPSLPRLADQKEGGAEANPRAGVAWPGRGEDLATPGPAMAAPAAEARSDPAEDRPVADMWMGQASPGVAEKRSTVERAADPWVLPVPAEERSTGGRGADPLAGIVSPAPAEERSVAGRSTDKLAGIVSSAPVEERPVVGRGADKQAGIVSSALVEERPAAGRGADQRAGIASPAPAGERPSVGRGIDPWTGGASRAPAGERSATGPGADLAPPAPLGERPPAPMVGRWPAMAVVQDRMVSGVVVGHEDAVPPPTVLGDRGPAVAVPQPGMRGEPKLSRPGESTLPARAAGVADADAARSGPPPAATRDGALGPPAAPFAQPNQFGQPGPDAAQRPDPVAAPASPVASETAPPEVVPAAPPDALPVASGGASGIAGPAETAPLARWTAPGLVDHAARQIVGHLDRTPIPTRAPPAEMALSPPELGRVVIRFEADPAGGTLHLLVERPETLDLMRRHVDLLETALRAAGHDGCSIALGGRDPGRGGGPPPDSRDPAPPAGDAAPGHGVVARPAGGGRLDLRL